MNSIGMYFGLVMRIYDDCEYLGRNASRRPAFSNDVAWTLRQTGRMGIIFYKIKSMRKYIIFIVLMTSVIGCTNQQNKTSRYSEEQIASLHLDSTTLLNVITDNIETIDLNPFLKQQHFDFGALIKNVKIIPLETTDESLIDDIYKVLVTDSNIYIMDGFKGRGIIIFNKEGKFIKRISNGQGPGELIRLHDIAFDSENNELIAYQHSFLLFFTPAGEFIQQKRLPFGFYNFTVIPNGYVFKALDKQGNEHLDILQYYTLFVTDKNFELNSVALPVLESDVNYGGYNYLYNNNNTISITHKFTDTVYHYINETNQLKARYALNYSKKKLPERYLQGTMNEFDAAISQNDYWYYIGEYLETESHHIFFLRNDYIRLQTIVYRDKQSGNLSGGTNADYNINEIPPFGFPIAASGKYLISTHYPSANNSLAPVCSMLSDEDNRKIKNLTEDDNPVLVFYELKDF
ncbi:hypothetical protein FACS189474_1060 [Bacteroidia bacterium]|nr:hypothetical protein FACS189474_1060 [Bacteroidia bacterium]